MNKPYVFMSRIVPEEAVNILKENFEVSIWEKDCPVTKERLLEEANKADGLYVMLTDIIDKELFDQAPNLKVVSNMAVGYDNIDVKTATEKGVFVTNTPGILSDTTADLTFGLLMDTARRLSEANRYLLEGKWTQWSPMLLAGQDVYGSTIGIIGMGRIGQAVAKRAKGFDMKILYHNRNRKPEVEKELGAEYRSLDDLLKESDFVVLLTPLTPETVNLIGKREFALMKSSAVFINVSRGATVDEEALYQALKNKEIWAAGLDVFKQEPIPMNHPLLELDNVVALPHIGSASIKTRRNMAILAAENLRDVLLKKESPHIINPEAKGN